MGESFTPRPFPDIDYEREFNNRVENEEKKRSWIDFEIFSMACKMNSPDEKEILRELKKHNCNISGIQIKDSTIIFLCALTENIKQPLNKKLLKYVI